MTSKIRIAFFIFFQIAGYSVTAQSTILFYKLDSLNGKPLGKITGITQDPSGTMWFCGQNEHCFYRYDGNKLTSFKHDNNDPNSLGFKDLETVYGDTQGLIWIGGAGLDRYNPTTGVFTHYRNLTGVTTILKDHKGRVWIGTFNGLNLLDEKTGNLIQFKNDSTNPGSISNDVIEVIYEDKKSVIWIGTGLPWNNFNEGGLNRINPDGSFTRYLHDPKNPRSLSNNKIRAILEDRQGNFWVGTSGEGLHIMNRDKGTFERYPYQSGHPNQLSAPKMNPVNTFDGVTFICEDKKGAIWLGSYLDGLSRYDPVTKKMNRYRGGNGFPDNTTFKGFISRDGILWVATEQSELLYRGDPGSKVIADLNTGYQPMKMMVSDGQTWISTIGGGLMQYNQNNVLIHQFKHIPGDPSSILNDTIGGLLKNPGEDSIWIGTGYGIVILNTISKKMSGFYFGNNADSHDFHVFHIIQDDESNLWVGTLGNGVIQYNRNTGYFKQFLPDPRDSASIGSPNIAVLYLDKDQHLWLGTWGEKEGIWKFNGATGKFKWYLPGNTGRRFYEDREGVLWATTNSGLFHYDRKEDRFLPFFDSQSAISNEMMVGITEDKKRNLWINSPSAIIKIDRERIHFFVFGRKFGISPGQGIFLGPICENAQGQILVGNEHGFYSFFPDELDVDMKPLQLSITDFFFNQDSKLTGKDNVLLNTAENKGEISLSYDQNNFGFKYSLNDYRSPEGVRYYTMLENYDPVWRQSGLEKMAYYFNLAPGDYVFRLKAFNSDETKGEKQVRIHISPPWWKTWWAYLLYAILLVAAIFGFVRFQKQRIIHQERLRTQMKELAQAKEIEKAYTELKATQAQLIQSEKMASLGELTAGIAHEIQNPLNFVNNFSEVNMELTAELKESLAKLKVGDKEKSELEEIANSINENEEKISHHGKRADAIVKGMLQHSRVSSGFKEPTDINQLADEYLRLAYHGLRAKDKTFNSAMQTEYDSGINKINIVPQDIGRVLLNLYNNAFYAVAEKSRQEIEGYKPLVEVSTKRAAMNIEICVKDNGNGIPKKILEKVFQPFFTTKPAGQGTGLGLSLSFDIIKAHGGEIKVDTREGQYTIFSIVLPI